MTRRRLLPAAALALVTVGAGGAAFADDLFAIRKAYEMFGGAFETLVGSYADPLDAERVVRRGIDAMLKTTDPYTVFYDERTLSQSQLARTGEGRPGLDVLEDGGRVIVGMPGDAASAYREGLRPGDEIVSVAGQPTVPERGPSLGAADVLSRLAGAPGTRVAVEVKRAGVAGVLRFDLTREAARSQSVTFAGFVGADTTAGVGLIRVAEFGQTAGSETAAAAKRLHDTGRLTALVLDLRDNPGGLVDAAVEIVGLFVPQNTAVVTTRERRPESARAFRTPDAPLLPDLPVVVLVSPLSASASEIVSGALQDLDRGAVVGTPTFGKGLIQRILPLPYRSGMKITQGRYLLPSGRVVQKLVYVDGVAREVPEAERRAFRTRAGRTVKDGRGIEPDLAVGVGAGEGTTSELVATLDREASFVRFAADRAARTPTASADVSAADVTAFRSWLGRTRTGALTPSERAADSLSARLSADGSALAADARRLRERLTSDRDALFARHDAEVRAHLRAAFVALATADARASARDAYAHDPTLDAALALLADGGRLRRMLGR